MFSVDPVFSSLLIVWSLWFLSDCVALDDVCESDASDETIDAIALLNALDAFDATLLNAAFASLDVLVSELAFDALDAVLDTFELVLEASLDVLEFTPDALLELVLDVIELTALEVSLEVLELALDTLLDAALEFLCFLSIKSICISASIVACLISAFTRLYSPCDGFWAKFIASSMAWLISFLTESSNSS